jgi:ABC-2 type transport system permease protein
VIRFSVVRAIFRRDFVGWFSSPTGYVFITVFIFLSSAAAFWQDAFFRDNLANLSQLNAVFPVLLLFLVPAITMSAWADERRQGVDELLLTLPAHDAELVVGKYLACLGIYTVSLAFSLSHVVVLAWLGSPDWGLMVSNYLAYWLIGASLLSVGMVGSALTDNLTVGFIAGSLLCALPVFLDRAGMLVGGAAGRALAELGAERRFDELTTGVVSFGTLAYFASIVATMLLANLYLVGKRRWRDPLFGVHASTRTLALLVAAASVAVLLGRLPVRADATAERLHSLSDPTRRVLKEIDAAKPVLVQAFLSKEVPRGYVETRENLLNLLREFAALGGERVRVNVIETERFTDEARRAQEEFGIRPVTLEEDSGGGRQEMEVFLGVAVTCGADEVVTPFFFKGFGVEYELTRSIRTVSQKSKGTAPAAGEAASKDNRVKIGVLDTDAKAFGGFDMNTFQSSPEWSLVAELKKQYDVVRVASDADYPEGLAVLVAILPSSLTQPQLERLITWVKSGKPTLILDDPFPTFIPGGAPGDPKGGQRNPFSPQGAPPEEKGKIGELMTVAGIRWRTDEIVWDKYNPHPRFAGIDPEIIFCGPGNGSREAFNRNEVTTSGLQEMVLIFPGHLEAKGTPGVNFIELLHTGRNSGVNSYDDVMQRSMFGGGGLNPNRKHKPGNIELCPAARTSGTVNVIMIADVDCASDEFFRFRRQGRDFLELDNITFILNCVDQLAGDETFVELRKRRPKHRTLDALEARTREHTERQLKEAKEADEAAEKQLKDAQQALDDAVAEIEKRSDLEETTKRIMKEQVRIQRQREFDLKKKQIDEQKEAAVEKSSARTKEEVEKVQRRVKVLGSALPPLPALCLGIVVFVMGIRRERGAARGERWAGGGK